MTDRDRPPADRLAWVDTAKGFCIVLVVMMHSTLGLEAAAGAQGWLHAVVEFARPFRIPAFFLIAGLFLSRTIDEPWSRFLDRKLVHFAYFYLLWLAIQIGVKTLPAGAGLTGFLGQVGLGLVQPFGTLWFIYLLSLFFLAARLLRAVPAPMVLVAGIAMATIPGPTGWVALDEFLGRFVFFFAGYSLAPMVFRMAEAARAAPLRMAGTILVGFALTALVVALRLGAAEPLAPLTGRVVDLALAPAGIAALVLLAAMLAGTHAGRMFQACGARSLVIYLAFFLPMALTRTVLVKTGLAGGLIDIGTASLLVTLVAVAVPLVLHRLVAGGPLAFLFERPRWMRLPRALSSQVGSGSREESPSRQR